jgi:CRP-like cAMP-binding protein
LPQGTVLFEVGDKIGHVYFPHSGVISLVVTLTSGETIETGMIGRDSLLGGSSALHKPFAHFGRLQHRISFDPGPA